MSKDSRFCFGHRYENIDPFGSNNLFAYYEDKASSSEKVVDDSHYRPNVNLIRSAMDAGLISEHGVYDFEDGKDNGFTPALRKLAPDRVEIDEAVATIKESAKKAKADQEAKELEAKNKELNDKALSGLSALSDALSSPDSSGSQSE